MQDRIKIRIAKQSVEYKYEIKSNQIRLISSEQD